MWEIIDYTKMRKSKKIILCPRCNRKGFVTNYTDGSISIKHKAEDHKWCLLITENCFFKKGFNNPTTERKGIIWKPNLKRQE